MLELRAIKFEESRVKKVDIIPFIYLIMQFDSVHKGSELTKRFCVYG